MLLPALFVVLAAALATAPHLPAQAKRALTVHIACTARGRELPRGGAAAGAYRLVDRELHWQVGDLRCDSLAAVGKELDRVYQLRSSWGPDPKDATKTMPIPIVLAPDPHCAWADVLATVDAVKRAKFETVQLAEACPEVVPGRCVQPPVVDGGELIVPPARFAEPDAPPAWRPTLDVMQDGRVRWDGKTVYDPKLQRDDRTTLRLALARLGSEAQRHKLKAQAKDFENERKVVTVPLLLRADCWVEWRHVQRLLQDLHGFLPAFVDLQFAVASDDAEAKFVEQQQPPRK